MASSNSNAIVAVKTCYQPRRYWLHVREPYLATVRRPDRARLPYIYSTHAAQSALHSLCGRLAPSVRDMEPAATLVYFSAHSRRDSRCDCNGAALVLDARSVPTAERVGALIDALRSWCDVESVSW